MANLLRDNDRRLLAYDISVFTALRERKQLHGEFREFQSYVEDEKQEDNLMVKEKMSKSRFLLFIISL